MHRALKPTWLPARGCCTRVPGFGAPRDLCPRGRLVESQEVGDQDKESGGKSGTEEIGANCVGEGVMVEGNKRW
jgi:hypothetical protein